MTPSPGHFRLVIIILRVGVELFFIEVHGGSGRQNWDPLPVDFIIQHFR